MSGFNKLLIQRAQAEGVVAGMDLICISVLHPKQNARSYKWPQLTEDARKLLDEAKAQKGEMTLMFKSRPYTHPSSQPKSIYFMTQ